MKQLLALISLLAVSITLPAQVYQTKNGVITVSGIYKGSMLRAESRQLHMNLNYDRAEINMHVAIPFLATENDTLNRLLAGIAGTELFFHGKLNSNHIHTMPHQIVAQQVSGTLSLNNVSQPFSYAATLEHFPSGIISCVLTGSFPLDLHRFGIPVFTGEDKVTVSFRVLLLKKAGE